MAKRPRLRYLTKLALAETYFTKSKEWEYEQEWRIYTIIPDEDIRRSLQNDLNSIVESGTIGGQTPCPVRLFDFPPSCVGTIILGCRASHQTRMAIAAVVKAKYPGARILRAETDATKFRLVFRPEAEHPGRSR